MNADHHVVRAHVYQDEWYPVWEVQVEDDGPVELPKELVERYEKNLAEFNAIQEALGDAAEARRDG